ncbi:hypothetical protein Tco_0559827 [Tanacetum coccineum]
MRSDSGVANADKVEISILGGTFELRGGDIGIVYVGWEILYAQFTTNLAHPKADWSTEKQNSDYIAVLRCSSLVRWKRLGSDLFYKNMIIINRGLGLNCCSREGMKAKSFEEGLAEVTETLKRLQFTLLFHQSKLEESIRQARQEFSLARQDFTLASEKFHRLIKATI